MGNCGILSHFESPALVRSGNVLVDRDVFRICKPHIWCYEVTYDPPACDSERCHRLTPQTMTRDLRLLLLLQDEHRTRSWIQNVRATNSSSAGVLSKYIGH